MTLAAYLAELNDAGRALSSASMAVAAVCVRATLAGEPNPLGKRTARVLAGYRRPAAIGDEAWRVRSGSRVVALPGPWPGDRYYRATSLCSRAV